MSQRRIPIIIILYLMLAGCSDDPGRSKAIQISHSIDSIRYKLDLPPLSGNLALESYGLDAAIWENQKDSFPKLWTKSVFWDSAGVNLERNYFYKSENERLQVYFIPRELKGIDTIGLCHFYQASLADSGTFLIKEQSDSILRSWKLK